MTRIAASIVLGITLAWTQTPERLTDREVKQLIEDVNQARDRFEDQLDPKIKSAVLRAPNGEVNVEKYLDDLQENVARLKERFTTEYSASKEAHTVMLQCTDINTYLRAQPPGLKGVSEWDTMARQLERLAQAYNTTFPLAPGAVVRRVNDAEVAKTADDLAKAASNMKKAVDKEATLPKDVRDGAKKDLDAVEKQAKLVKDRVQDSKPATAEIRLLLDAIVRVDGFMKTQTALQPATTTAWTALQAPLVNLRQVYGVQTP